MKLVKYILGITLLLFVIVFFATMPGRTRKNEGIKTETTPPVSSESVTAPPAVSEPGETAKPVGGEPDETEGDTTPKEEIDNEWALYLVNQTNPLPDDFTLTAAKVYGDYEMDERAAPYMKEMIAAAKTDGVNLSVISALRTIERQKKLLENEIKIYTDKGLDREDAYKKATEAVAVPGQSEHNAGLCADLLEKGNFTLTEGFEDTKEFKWLSEHAAEYGFILRYPKSKEAITGIIYEPWHYRFVGKYHAKAINESGLSLEEYIAKNKH